MGQSYDDITSFSSEKFLDSIFGDSSLISETELLSNNIIQPDITKQDTKRNGKIETDMELPNEKVILRSVTNEDTFGRPIQKIDETPSELLLDSDDTSSRKYESLDKVASNKHALQQKQADLKEPHFEEPRIPEQLHDSAHPEEPEQKKKQGYLEEQPQVITVTSDKKPESISEKKEPGGFFKGLFGKKNKYQTKDPENDTPKDMHTIESSQKNLHSSVESEKKSETKDLVKDNEKKTKSQNKDEEEIVYLTDEDIEDLLK
jgi:hypothetical protein